MSTFALSTSDNYGDVIAGLNYALANLGTTVSYNGNVLLANTTTGIISTVSNTGVVSSAPLGYLYNYVNVKYANTATGGSGFSNIATNTQYYGVRNTTDGNISNNPVDYVWYQATGGFGTTKSLYYQPLGGNQINFYAGTIPPSSNYYVVPVDEPILLLLPAQNAVTTTAIAPAAITTNTIANQAVTNSVSVDYGFNTVNQYLYKMPKLNNYSSYYWNANTQSVILAATITPTENESTIVVSYSVEYNNDTSSSIGANVSLYRSQFEGNLNPLYSSYGGYAYPNLLQNFRKVKVAYTDPNSSTTAANTYPIISGYWEKVSTSPFGLMAIANVAPSGNIVGSLSYTGSIGGGLPTWANVITGTYQGVSGEPKYDLVYTGDPTTSYQNQSINKYGAINGYYFNGNINVAYPIGSQNEWALYSTDSTYESWGNATGSGTPVKHPAIVTTNRQWTGDINIGSGPESTSQYGGAIYRVANDTANANIVIETTSTYGLNAISSTLLPYNYSSKTGGVAVAVGDYGTILRSANRSYDVNGNFTSNSSTSPWTQETITLGYGVVTGVGNIYGVAFSSNTIQSGSSYTAGAGADANSSMSNTFVLVGEEGMIYYRSSSGYWTSCLGYPPNTHGTTLRGITYDAYRYRWWAVGDYGTVLWAEDRVKSGSPQLVWNQYNSGTLKNLYDIKYDPITTNFTIVGDGIVMVDNGQTIVNGQRSYPLGKSVAYDASAGTYSSSTPGPYEPVLVQQYASGNTSVVLDGYSQYNQTAALLNPNWPTANTANVQIQPGTIVTGQYVEQQAVGSNQYVFNHFGGIPVTYYLVCGAPTNSNVIIGNPSMVVTEYKR